MSKASGEPRGVLPSDCRPQMEMLVLFKALLAIVVISEKRSIELSQTCSQPQNVRSFTTGKTPELTESFDHYHQYPIWHLAKPGTLATECDHIQRCYQCLRTGLCWESWQWQRQWLELRAWQSLSQARPHKIDQQTTRISLPGYQD